MVAIPKQIYIKNKKTRISKSSETKDEKKSYSMRGVWNIFSKFIRIRDVNEEGYGLCITHKAHTNPAHTSFIHWKQGQAGHYKKRYIKALLFDEKNVHLQCYICNEIRDGEPEFYKDEIISRYGEEEHNRMVEASRDRDRYTGAFKPPMLKDLRDQFIEKLNTETDKKGWLRIEKPWR